MTTINEVSEGVLNVNGKDVYIVNSHIQTSRHLSPTEIKAVTNYLNSQNK